MTAIITPDLVFEDRIRNARFKVTWGLLAAQIYDCWITFQAFDVGAHEANPAAKLLIGLGLVVPLKIGIALLALWKAKYGKPSKHRWNNISELPAFGIACCVLGIYLLALVLNTLTYFHYN